MKPSTFPVDTYEQQLAARIAAAEDLAASALESEEAAAPHPREVAPTCQNCNSAIKDPTSTVCRRCGYYPKLGRVIDLDESERELAEGEVPQAKSHVQVWMEILPKFFPLWGIAVFACLAAVIGESIAVSRMVPATNPLRAEWAVIQLLVGLGVFVTVHLVVFIRAMIESDRNFVDVVVKPLSCWFPTFRKLPSTTPYVALGASALAAIIGSTCIIGSIPYEKIFETKKAPAKPHMLVAAVSKMSAPTGNEETNLEDAISSFAGEDETIADQEGDKDKKNKKKEKESKIIPSISVDCVIVGYEPMKDDPSNFKSLVLAANTREGLRIVGTVGDNIPENIREHLCRRFVTLHRDAPFIASAMEAQWLEPQLACRVLCEKRLPSGQLVEPQFATLLTEMN